MWMINLANSKLVWEKCKKSGISPTQRSGMSGIVDKRKLIVFGGVVDDEKEEEISSIFFNQL